MKILNFQDFMKKYKLKNDTGNEMDLKRVYNYKIHPTDSKVITDKGFVITDNGFQGDTHWTCLHTKDNK